MRLLVVGAPRSGTTWVGRALARAPRACYVHEPDNPDADPAAQLGQRSVGLFPVLRQGEDAGPYTTAWDLAFRGGWPRTRVATTAAAWIQKLPESPRALVVGALARLARVARPKPLHVVVKSVHCAFSVDWLAERYRPEVVVVRRNPLNVVASFHRFRPQTEHMPELDAVFLHPVVQADVVRPSGIPAPPTEGTPLERLAWRVGLEQAAFDVALARHSTWVAVDHDRLCENPEERFRQLFARLRLPWDPAVERFLDQSNRPSQEFFGTDRVTAGQPRAWRTSFTPSELDQVTRILGAFPGQGELSRLEKPSSPIGLVHVTSEPVDAGAE